MTDITLVVDRSGSMSGIQADAEGGVNSFIEQQVQESGVHYSHWCNLTMNMNLCTKEFPLGQVPKYDLMPHGMTALLDAVGTAINETGERLSKMKEQDRPELVIFVVMTDGLENSSREFTKAQVKEMIEEQQTKYNWHFTFLGADQEAFAEAVDWASMPRAPPNSANNFMVWHVRGLRPK